MGFRCMQRSVGLAAILTELSPAHLAEMGGNTRSRVSFFMNQFRKLGFISYDVGDNLHISQFAARRCSSR